VAELVPLEEIRVAAHRIAGVVVRTPLVPFAGAVAPSDARPPSPGRPDLLVKPESLQPTGAFKLRGAYNAIRALT
jgi:threonine dehydratase